MAASLKLQLLLYKAALLLSLFHPLVVSVGNDDITAKIIVTKPLYIEDEKLVYFEILEPNSLRYIYKSRPARNFGTNFNQSYASAELVLGEPLVGCSRLTNYHEIRGNSVLLLRGQCTFLTKAVMAEEAGALFLIVADDDVGSTNTRLDMVHDDTNRNVNIPVVFISGKDGLMIREEMLKESRANYALVNIPVNLTSIPYHKRKHPPWTLI